MISALEKENRLIDYFVKKGIRHFTGWVEQAEKYDPREGATAYTRARCGYLC